MKQIIAAAITALSLAACATQPEPCTAEWVEWKTERVLSDFSRGHREEIRALREASERFLSSKGGEITFGGAMGDVLTATSSVMLATDFVSEAWPDIQSAVGQCGNAPGAAKLFADLMRREGVHERLVNTIESLGVWVETQG